MSFDPRFIHWYEGMFLMPQHFQQNDFYFLNMQRYLMDNFLSFSWGVKSMKIDFGALAENIFRIDQIECIFQTNDVLIYDVFAKQNSGQNNTENLLELNLNENLNDIFQRPLKVYLCLPKILSERYVPSDMHLVSNALDMTDEQKNAEYLSKLNLNVQLVLADVPPAKYVSLPVVEISSNASGLMITDYVGPMIFLDASSKVMNELTSIVVKTRRKISYFGRKTNDLSADNTSHALRSVMIMRSALIANFLKFDYMVKFNSARSYELFCEFLSFISGISIIAQKPLLTLSEYDHYDINKSFLPLIKYANEVLESVQESYEEKIINNQNNVFSVFLEKNAYEKGVQPDRYNKILLEFFVSDFSDKVSLKKWVESSIIASDKYINSVCDSRILGAERKILDLVEDIHLFSKENSVLVEIDFDDPYVMLDSYLVIFNVSEEFCVPNKAVFYRFINEKDGL